MFSYNKNMRKYYIWIILLILAIGGIWFGPKAYNWYQRWQYERSGPEISTIPTAPTTPIDDITPTPTATQITPTPTIKETTIPKQMLIKNVPFTSQAPYGKWDEVHEETCEEAAVLIVDKYLQGRREAVLPPSEVEHDLQAMIEWEQGYFGTYLDTTIAQTATMAKEYSGYKNTSVAYDIDVNDIKAQIAKGRPVIIPTAGRMLGNPYFTAPGPVYHFLVIIGYTQNEFITNDPGTRHGRYYHYKIDTVMNAIHDWTGKKSTIKQGRKAMMILKK